MIDVIIIGAGASGMMAAIKAAKNKKVKVTILEHSYEAGKKLLATADVTSLTQKSVKITLEAMTVRE